MKKFILLGVVVLTVLGCQVVEDNLDILALDPQAQEAILLARQEVVSISSDESSSIWNGSSTVVNAFPLYLDGIDEISYYECKVMTNGQNSGYVLVNVNDTDFPIVEAQEDGVTVNEIFEEMTGLSKEELVICRYSYIANAAFMKKDKNDSTLRSRGANASPIATIGFMPDDFDYDQYRTQVKAKGGSLYSTVETVPKNDVALFGLTGKGNNETSLKNVWWSNRSTPPWNQFLKTPIMAHQENYELIGCGAVAHAIVLAYWDRFKGRPNLFFANNLESLDYTFRYNSAYTLLNKLRELSSSAGISLANDIQIIARGLGTSPVGIAKKLNFNPSQYGRSYIKYRLGYSSIGNMSNIADYAKARNYTNSTAIRDNGGYDSKFNKIYDSLAEDRPVIMGIHSDGIGAVDHYVVIERAKRQSISRNSYIRYFCNFGWGGTYKWVYAYNQKPVGTIVDGEYANRFSTYSFWDINIK